jgi:hypothetical protein
MEGSSTTMPSGQPIPPPQRPMYQEIIHPRTAATLALVGVLLFFIGMIIAQSGTMMAAPDYDDYSDYDDYEKALTDYRSTMRLLFGFGKILGWFGILIIAMPLYIIGISSERLDWKVRATMLSSATALIIAAMVVSIFMAFPTYY